MRYTAVRWTAWTVVERQPHRVVMQNVLYPQPGYPFSLGISIEYSLTDIGLQVRTTATNLGPDLCPFGDPLILSVPARTVLLDPTNAVFRSAPTPLRARNTIFDSRGGSAQQRSTMRSPTSSEMRMVWRAWCSEIRTTTLKSRSG